MTTKNELLRIIRLNCGECMGGSRTCEGHSAVNNPSDIEGCTAEDCAFYRFRFAEDPDKNPSRVLAAKRLQKYHTAKPGR